MVKISCGLLLVYSMSFLANNSNLILHDFNFFIFLALDNKMFSRLCGHVIDATLFYIDLAIDCPKKIVPHLSDAQGFQLEWSSVKLIYSVPVSKSRDPLLLGVY